MGSSGGFGSLLMVCTAGLENKKYNKDRKDSESGAKGSAPRAP